MIDIAMRGCYLGSVRTTVNIPEPALLLCKRKAVEKGITLGEAIADAIDSTYRERPQSSRRKRRPMPVSTATGGPLPGIDLGDRSTFDHLLGERL